MTRAVRRLVVAAALVAVAGLAVAFARGGMLGLRTFAATPPAARTPVGLLAPLGALAAAAGLAWLVLSCALTAAGGLPGQAGRHARASARHVVPTALRTALAAVLGGSLALAATPTSARPPRPVAAAERAPGASGSAVQAGPDGAPGAAAGAPLAPAPPTWTPGPPPAGPAADRADVTLVTSAPRTGRGDHPLAQSNDRVVVRRGDTLWAIAAAHLPPGAGAAEVDRAWPRWYAANRTLIGPDPDVLRPGQLLVRPPDV